MSKSQAAVNWQKKQVSIEKSNFCNKKQKVEKKLVKKKEWGIWTLFSNNWAIWASKGEQKENYVAWPQWQPVIFTGNGFEEKPFFHSLALAKP